MDFQLTKVGEIGEITTGLVVKRKQALLIDQVVNTYRMLTLKSFDQDGWLNINELEEFQSTEILDSKYLTKEGDVIVRLSYPHTAIAINKEHEGILVPSLFVIIRMNIDSLLAEYFSIYLNSDKMKRFYSQQAIGSTIQIIKTSMLKEVLVTFPSLEKQTKVIELNRLIRKEKVLLKKLIEEKTTYNREILNSLITGRINYGE